MKTVTILLLLALQATASFFGEFQGAMSNIQHGIGKLFSDVIVDVKETLQCTISAVEHVLVLNGILDKNSAYNKTCNYNKESESPPPMPHNITQPSDAQNENLTKHFFHDLKNSIENVNKTMTDVLANQVKLKNISENFANDTKRLIEISEILRRELENISNNIKNKTSNSHLDDNKLSVNSIWDEIKALNDLQRNNKNTSEVNEIRSVLNKVTNGLSLTINNRQTLNSYELDQIKKQLQKYTRNEKSFATNQSLLFTPEKLTSEITNTSYKSQFKNVTVDDLNHKRIFRKQTPEKINSKSVKDYSQTQKSVFSTDLDGVDYFTPPNNETIQSAKKIIEDSQHFEKALDNFFQEEHNSDDVFNNTDILNFNGN